MDEHIKTCKKIIENWGCEDMHIDCFMCHLEESCKGMSDSIRAAKQYLKENNDMGHCKEMKEYLLKRHGIDILDKDTITLHMYDSMIASYCPFCGRMLEPSQPKTPSNKTQNLLDWVLNETPVEAGRDEELLRSHREALRYLLEKEIGRESADIPPEGV